MGEQLSQRLTELARRAGLAGLPPAAVGAALVLCLLAVGAAAWRWWPRQSAYGGTSASLTSEVGTSDLADPADGSGGRTAAEATASSSTEAASPARVYVHVVGAVRRPGMYELDSGCRVADAVEAAGGLLANAAQQGVNLARAISDGEQITVPTLDEFALGPGAVSSGGGSSVGVSDSGSSNSEPGDQVNINTADVTALDALPGVGPSTAAKIIADREANGPFASADDLGRVTGIGPKKLEELKPRVRTK